MIKYIILFCLMFAGSSIVADGVDAAGLSVAENSVSSFRRQAAPVVLLTGTENLNFTVAKLLDKEYLTENSADEITAELLFAGRVLPLKCIAPAEWRFSLDAAPSVAGWGRLRFISGDGKEKIIDKAVRVVEKFRVTLTFDDGPAVNKRAADSKIISGSPTVITLDALDAFRHGANDGQVGIKAAFFVLTTPDHFIFFTFPKAENENGKNVLKEVAKRGHVLGVHWGGKYAKQSLGHDRRVLMPAYQKENESGEQFDNALECDIAECISTIEKLTGQQPEFVRPPFWRYQSKKDPSVKDKVAAVYKEFGLKMILTDAKFPDGGYSIISIISIDKYRKFPRLLRRAFLSGEDNLVISMHDSNSYTAGSLGYILDKIKEVFSEISFSGVNDMTGWRLDFADSAEEVRKNLRDKQNYVLFPDYRDKSEGER